MLLLRELVESGRLKPVVERIYGLKETPEALSYVGKGHVPGKVVISVVTE